MDTQQPIEEPSWSDLLGELDVHAGLSKDHAAAVLQAALSAAKAANASQHVITALTSALDMLDVDLQSAVMSVIELREAQMLLLLCGNASSDAASIGEAQPHDERAKQSPKARSADGAKSQPAEAASDEKSIDLTGHPSSPSDANQHAPASADDSQPKTRASWYELIAALQERRPSPDLAFCRLVIEGAVRMADTPDSHYQHTVVPQLLRFVSQRAKKAHQLMDACTLLLRAYTPVWLQCVACGAARLARHRAVEPQTFQCGEDNGALIPSRQCGSASDSFDDWFLCGDQEATAAMLLLHQGSAVMSMGAEELQRIFKSSLRESRSHPPSPQQQQQSAEPHYAAAMSTDNNAAAAWDATPGSAMMEGSGSGDMNRNSAAALRLHTVDSTLTKFLGPKRRLGQQQQMPPTSSQGAPPSKMPRLQPGDAAVQQSAARSSVPTFDNNLARDSRDAEPNAFPTGAIKIKAESVPFSGPMAESPVARHHASQVSNAMNGKSGGFAPSAVSAPRPTAMAPPPMQHSMMMMDGKAPSAIAPPLLHRHVSASHRQMPRPNHQMHMPPLHPSTMQAAGAGSNGANGGLPVSSTYAAMANGRPDAPPYRNSAMEGKAGGGGGQASWRGVVMSKANCRHASIELFHVQASLPPSIAGLLKERLVVSRILATSAVFLQNQGTVKPVRMDVVKPTQKQLNGLTKMLDSKLAAIVNFEQFNLLLVPRRDNDGSFHCLAMACSTDATKV